LNRATKLLVAVFLTAFVHAAHVSAQNRTADGASKTKTLSERSYAQARRVLEAGMTALGGLDAIRAAEDVSVKISGYGYARNQSLVPTDPYAKTRHDESLFIDLRKRRYIVEVRDEGVGGFVFGGRNIIDGDQGWFINPRDKILSPINLANFNNIGIIRRVPHVMLLSLYDNGLATLRYLGEETFEGRKQQVLTAASSNGIQWTLYFDAATNLLTKYEQVVSDGLAGDAVQEWVFTGYRSVGNLKVPTGRITRRAGELVEEVTYDDVQLNTKPAESAFSKPDGFEEFPTPQPPATRETKLAEGVYLFESGANSLVVEFSDHLLVVEPYAGGRGARAVIAKAKEMFPGKPVRYVVVTHYHDDHSGGLRAYIAEGATVVTTPENQKFFERMAASTFTVAPDDQSKANKKPVFEFVRDGKRVFTDGKQTVEVIDLGANPHARGMLVAYVPQEKLVFQGDLVNLPQNGRYLPSTINDTSLQFYDAISRLGLQVERIAAVHGPSTTLAELREAVERKRAAR
jgi:glyoxylase-like metal-dependent hydrolase (beta-lactamase superfamily II)